MSKIVRLGLFFMLFSLIGLAVPALPSELPTIASLSHKAPSFTKNEGQWDTQVLFRGEGNGTVMWLLNDAILYQFTRTRSDQSDELQPLGVSKQTPKIEQMLLKTTFVGAKSNPAIISEGLMEYKCNFFLGNDSTKWQTDVPNYEAVTYHNLYDGIDLEFRRDQGRIIGEFIVAPEADYRQIKVRYEGAKSLSFGPDGELLVETEWGVLSEPTPTISQEQSGTKKSLASSYELVDDQTLGLVVENGLNRSSGSTFSLALSFSTFLGGGGDDRPSDVAVTSNGEAIVIGETYSSDFPLASAPDGTLAGGEGFVTKFNSAGTGLMFSSYLGGALRDYCTALSLTGSTQYAIFLTGSTSSSDFPTANPLDGTFNGQEDAFLASLNSTGNTLTFSTYLGGSQQENGNDLATACVAPCNIDRYTIWVVGETYSTDFPTVNAYSTVLGGLGDAFLSNYTVGATGNFFNKSTYFGGTSFDGATSVAIVGSLPAKPYICGWTNSSVFPTVNAFDNTFAAPEDGIVAGFDFAGNGAMYPVFSTYFGATGLDEAHSIIIRSSGNICFAGQARANGLATAGTYDNSWNGSYDAYVAELNIAGTPLNWCTYVGGDSIDNASTVVEKSGKLYVTGSTQSANFPNVNAYDNTLGGAQDAFLSVLNSTGSSLVASTFLGGSLGDFGNAIAVDNSGCAYLTGNTPSVDFPLVSPYDGSNVFGDGFLTKICVPLYLCGDANGSGAVSISDAVFLINYIFAGGPAPNPVLAADANCSGTVSISDAVYLINYIFAGGPAPCAACP